MSEDEARAELIRVINARAQQLARAEFFRRSLLEGIEPLFHWPKMQPTLTYDFGPFPDIEFTWEPSR